MFLIKFDLYLFYQNETITIKLKIMKTIILTFENGTTERIYNNDSISFAKNFHIGSWRPNGIVINVRRERKNENIQIETFETSKEHFVKYDGTYIR